MHQTLSVQMSQRIDQNIKNFPRFFERQRTFADDAIQALVGSRQNDVDCFRAFHQHAATPQRNAEIRMLQRPRAFPQCDLFFGYLALRRIELGKCLARIIPQDADPECSQAAIALHNLAELIAAFESCSLKTRPIQIVC